MIPPGECMYAGRKRRKPVQKQRPSAGSEKSNPSKRHRDRLNAELDRLASLLPFPPEIITKLDKLSILRLSVSYLRVKNFFQAIEEQHSKKQPCQPVGHAIKDKPSGGTAMPEGELLLESLNGFALVVSTEGMIFYASATILDYLGFHQTDVMHQNVYDYIHVDDRQEFCRQLHWAMNPQQMVLAQESHTETGEDLFLNKIFKAQESNNSSEYSPFLNRFFICRVRCLLDSTSGFLTMQFEGKLKFLFGQKKKASLGTIHPPQMALFCIAVPLLLPPITDIKMKSMLMRTQKKPGATSNTDNTVKSTSGVCDAERDEKNIHQAICFPNMLHSAENQIKLMNTSDNGISLLKVRANEDQWVWANAPMLYRNGCSDYVVVPAQAQREDEELIKKQNSMSGMKSGRDALQGHSNNEHQLHMKHHHTWGKQGMEDLKFKFHATKNEMYLPEETSIFSKHFSNVQNHCNTNSGWPLKSPSTSRPNHQLVGAFPNRTSRTYFSPDQSHSGAVVIGRPNHGSSENFQHYGLQQHSVDSYLADNIKLEGSFASPEILYESGMPLNIPIKIENDSDSEDRTDVYSEVHAQSWIGESSALKKPMLDFHEGLHVKTESDLSEQISCLKPKHHSHTPRRGHYFMPATHINHFNVNRPFKGIYNKEAAQFCPQKCAYVENPLSLQGSDCLNSQFYAASTVDEKCQSDNSYKLQYEFKAHSLVPNIKREPLDSPPWGESEQEAVQSIYQRNTLMGFLPSQMQRNAELSFIQ
uniref:Aryl hydrocarbon receptor repressor n=1 Tax=Leptobrachium leishanense TaxID=445787 RepID=A0A8C5WE09_9ANUR